MADHTFTPVAVLLRREECQQNLALVAEQAYEPVRLLVINTSTTIITFLMVFVLQNSQNRDGKALQAKLDELILTSQARNKFIGIEKLDEESLRQMSKTLAEKADCMKTSPTIRRTCGITPLPERFLLVH